MIDVIDDPCTELTPEQRARAYEWWTETMQSRKEKMEHQKPSVGRVVHYYATPTQAEPWPGFVTKVHGDFCVNVAGFNDGGTQYSQSSVTHSEGPTATGPRWCWPPRV